MIQNLFKIAGMYFDGTDEWHESVFTFYAAGFSWAILRRILLMFSLEPDPFCIILVIDTLGILNFLPREVKFGSATNRALRSLYSSFVSLTFGFPGLPDSGIDIGDSLIYICGLLLNN